ncbi:Heteroproteinous nuclear ribonucleoprotein A0 [Mactra antiquata]
MEAFGSGQNSISPEFLQNIQSAVNSQGVLGQVQVIETENGPVTVLFMEEGADASGAVGENVTLNVNSGVESYVVHSEPSVSEQTEETQYQFVVSENEYQALLQGNTGAVDQTAVLSTVTETADEVTTIPPVIDLPQTVEVEQSSQPVTATSEFLYTSAVSDSVSVPNTTIETDVTTVPETSVSSDTYYITDTGEVVKIDSSMLGNNPNAVIQMQDTGNGLQVVNTELSEEDNVATQAIQTQSFATNVITTNNTTSSIKTTKSPSTPFEFTATKVDNRLVIDGPKEEPKVLSYKTTNRQRVNLMRQPPGKSSLKVAGTSYTVSQPTKVAKSLLPASLKPSVPTDVIKKPSTLYTSYSAPYQKQTIVHTGMVKPTSGTSIIRTVQPKIQSENVVTTVVRPQALKKAGLLPATNKDLILGKLPLSKTSTPLIEQRRKVLVPKFTSHIVSKPQTVVSKNQSDILMTAMEESSVSPQVKPPTDYAKKQVVSPNPMVVRDPSTATVTAESKVQVSSNIVNMPEDKSEIPTIPLVDSSLPSMPLLEPEISSANGIEGMEVDEPILASSDPSSSCVADAASEITSTVPEVPEEKVPEITSTVAESSTVDSTLNVDDKLVTGTNVETENIIIPTKPSVSSSTVQQIPQGEPKNEVVDKNNELNIEDNKDMGTQVTDLADDKLKCIDVPNSDVTIQLFADGTLVTKDKAGTNFSTVKLEDLGLDMSMLESNTDIELLIVQGDGKEVRATINTSKHVNPVSKVVTPSKQTSKKDVVERPVTKPDSGMKLPTTPVIDKSMEGKEMVSPTNEARPYKCSMCPRTFKFYRTFKCHEIVHSKAITFTCHLCNRLFAREVNLKSHLELHRKKEASSKLLAQTLKGKQKQKLESVPKACYDCGKMFENESKMKKHYSSVHESKPRYPCPICGNLFKTQLVLQKHSRVHAGPFVCPHCLVEFEKRDVYDAHIVEQHRELMHTCEDCGVVLPSKQAYAMHVVFQHKERSSDPHVKNKECLLCDRKLASQELLEKHMFIHSSERNQECPECGESFKVIWQLDKHVRDMHDNNVTFSCNHCPDTFSKRAKLELHTQLYHVGPYQCHICSEEFFDRKLLEEHQSDKHEMNFSCRKCDMTFNGSQKLRRHYNEDHASRAFVCEICDEGFEIQGFLRTHLIERHFRGDRKEMFIKYPEMKAVNSEILCDLCGENFMTRNLCKFHVKDFHFGGNQNLLIKHFPLFSRIPDPPSVCKCDHCGKDFRTLSRLNKHLNTHLTSSNNKKKGKGSAKASYDSGGDIDEDEEAVDFTNIEPREIEREYDCTKCDAQFSRKAALDKHMQARHKRDKFKEALKELEKEELERAEKEEALEVTGEKTEKTDEELADDNVSAKTVDKTESKKKLKQSPRGRKPERFICKICEQLFWSAKTLTAHVEDVHKEEEEIPDEVKGYSLEQIKCLTCDRYFTETRYLRRHLRRVHNVFKISRNVDDERVLTCEHCPRTFDNAGNLKSHVKAKHSDNAKKLGPGRPRKKKASEDDFDESVIDDDDDDDGGNGDISEFLGMNFNLTKTSTCNMESVKKKQHKCTNCGKAFSREAALKKHIALHEEEEDSDMIEAMEADDLSDLQPPMYPCKSCDSKYSTALGLIHHNRNKHADVDEETVLAEILEVDEKFKAESPKKKIKEEDTKKSVKRKAESPRTLPSPKKKARRTSNINRSYDFECNLCDAKYSTNQGLVIHKTEVHIDALKKESPAKTAKFSHSGRLITHSKKVRDQIQCDKCTKTFMQEQHLMMHYTRVHCNDIESKPTSYDCDICTKSYDKASKLSLHKKMKHNINTPSQERSSSSVCKCEVCGWKFKSSADLKQHMLDEHNKIKTEPPSCDICHLNFITKKSLDIHMRRHTGEKPYKCCLCSNTFISKFRLECHMKRFHLRQWQKKVKCKVCLALFKDEKTMTKHREIHKKQTAQVEKVVKPSVDKVEKQSVEKVDRRSLEPHKCSICGKSFRWTRTLNAHFATHKKDKEKVKEVGMKDDIDTFICGICDKVFPDKESIKNHMTTHKKSATTAEVHTCKICDKSFSKASGLRLHETMAHKEGEKDFPTTPKTPATPNLYKCGVCDKAFTKKSGLRMHEVAHTGSLYAQASKVSCNICQKSFHSKETLMEHMLSHTSIMRFQCEECLVSFKHKYSLDAHKLIHNLDESKKKKSGKSESERPINCPKCNKSFSSLIMLRNHARKVHTAKHTKRLTGASLVRKRMTRSSSAESKDSKEEKKKVGPSLTSKVSCKICKNVFTRPETLKTHMDKFHPKEKIKISKKPSSSTKSAEESSDREFSHVRQKVPATHKCPSCDKKFTQRYNLRLHLINKHNAKMEKIPKGDLSSRKKWLYCKECASLFWSQGQYNQHMKLSHPDQASMELDNQVMMSLSKDPQVEFEPAGLEFQAIQHKCEFCSSVYLTKKSFDEHILKEHPDHAEEYGITPEVAKPSIEIINDNEDLMGNLISVGICDVENCKKLSSLPVVSLERLQSGDISLNSEKETFEDEEAGESDTAGYEEMDSDKGIDDDDGIAMKVDDVAMEVDDERKDDDDEKTKDDESNDEITMATDKNVDDDISNANDELPSTEVEEKAGDPALEEVVSDQNVEADSSDNQVDQTIEENENKEGKNATDYVIQLANENDDDNEDVEKEDESEDTEEVKELKLEDTEKVRETTEADNNEPAIEEDTVSKSVDSEKVSEKIEQTVDEVENEFEAEKTKQNLKAENEFEAEKIEQNLEADIEPEAINDVASTDELKKSGSEASFSEYTELTANDDIEDKTDADTIGMVE